MANSSSADKWFQTFQGHNMLMLLKKTWNMLKPLCYSLTRNERVEHTCLITSNIWWSHLNSWIACSQRDRHARRRGFLSWNIPLRWIYLRIFHTQNIRILDLQVTRNCPNPSTNIFVNLYISRPTESIFNLLDYWWTQCF